MSIEAMIWVMNYSESERAARLVLLSIANNANNEGNEAYPSIETICRNARLSETAVHRAISALVMLGELTVEIGASRWRTNLYCLPKFSEFTKQLQGAKNEVEGAKNENGTVPKVIYLGCQKNSNLAPKPLLKVLTSEPSTNKQQNLKAFILPEWVPKELWDGFDEMRRKMPSKSSWTDYARRLTIKDLEKLAAQGEDIQACLEQSIQRGYRGVFPVKQNGGNGNGNNGNGRLSGNELEEYNKRNFAEALRRGEERDRQNALWASDGDGGEGRPGPH